MRLMRYGNDKKYDWRASELRRFRKRKVESLRKMIKNYGQVEVLSMFKEALSLPFDQQSEAFFEGVVKVLE